MSTEEKANDPSSDGREHLRRLRGLRALVEDAVEHGAAAAQDLHLATASVPFQVLERVPGLELPVQEIRAVHDEVVRSSYRVARLINRAVARSFDAVLDAVSPPSPS